MICLFHFMIKNKYYCPFLFNKLRFKSQSYWQCRDGYTDALNGPSDSHPCLHFAPHCLLPYIGPLTSFHGTLYLPLVALYLSL